jgi:hypothetical protein
MGLIQPVAGIVQFGPVGATQASAGLTIKLKKSLKAW